MSILPDNYKYAKTHEWVKLEDKNLVRVGITDFAQQELGDLVYVELPEVKNRYKSGEQCAVVESVKTASDLFSPVSGEIVAINEALAEEPEQVNNDPYQAWLFCLQADDLSEIEQLMDATAYGQMIKE